MAADKVFAPDFLALLDEKKVPQSFRDFLLEEGCLSIAMFAAATSKEDRVDEEIIDASGKSLKWGEKIAVRLTWTRCREISGLNNPSGSSGSTGTKSKSKMPDGTENFLRKTWKDKHNFNMLGNGLVNEGLMAKIYEGLQASPMSFFVPDMANICRKSNLTQKPIEGTLVTSSSVERVEYYIEPCTTHPEWFMRFRAFLMTVCWCAVGHSQVFLSFETALAVCDFIFEAVNCRPDGKRPTVACLNSCFLAMFGEYASLLQNEGKILEDFLKAKAIWEHYWKESIVSFETPGKSPEHGSAVKIEGDLVSMVKGQDRLLRSLQGSMDRNMANVHKRIDQSQGQRLNHQQQGGKFWGQQQSQKNGGNPQKGNGADKNANGKRQVSAGENNQGWQGGKRKKGKKGKGGGKR